MAVETREQTENEVSGAAAEFFFPQSPVASQQTGRGLVARRAGSLELKQPKALRESDDL